MKKLGISISLGLLLIAVLLLGLPTATAQQPSLIPVYTGAGGLIVDTTFGPFEWRKGSDLNNADVFFHVDVDGTVAQTTTTMNWYLDVSADNSNWAVHPTLSSMTTSLYADWNGAYAVPIYGNWFRIRADVSTTTMSFTPVLYAVLRP